MSGNDVELGCLSNTATPSMLEGFPSFAQFIARDGDAAIFRKYAHLGARNLLYLQSELHHLDRQLRQLDGEDAKHLDNDEAQKAAREWGHFSDPKNERARQHRTLQENIKSKLKEYRTSLNE